MKGVLWPRLNYVFFDPNMEVSTQQALAAALPKIVFRVHYPDDVASRMRDDKLILAPGDITLVVPVIDRSISQSNAQFEVEITEGSSNWPETQPEVQARAERVSELLAALFGEISHNIFEVNGVATGWVQYSNNKS